MKKSGLDQRIAKLAREKFGFEKLRPGQMDAIRAVLDKRDTLVVQPTGSGKSAIYQLAGLLIDGPTVVISPLIALQKDQLDSIQENNLAEAAVVNSHERVAEVRDAFEKLEEDELEFLFLAPEQLHKPETMDRLLANPPSLFVIDEAHCISEWGHDFRPDYLRLGAAIEALKHPVVLALTATAAPLVREEIIARLGMRDPEVIVRGFDRPNIFLHVETLPTENDKREAVLARAEDAAKPGIIYTATRKHAEEIARALADRGLNAASYHGGLPAKERREIQQSFMKGEIQVMAATNAFGMGVDKSDVRFVYHYDVPDSLDSYYQEIGRSGRDGQPAEAILFYRPEDLRVPKFLKAGGKVGEDEIREVEQALEQAGAPVPIEELKEATDLSERKLEKVVNRLEEAGAVQRLPSGEAALAESAPDLDQAARIATQEEEKRREYERLRIDKMQAYAELRDCRREYLLRYFGDEEVAAPCGRCDNCARKPEQPQPDASEPARRKPAKRSHPQGPFPVHSRVEHSQLGRGVVQKCDGDKVEILFDDAGKKTLSVPFLIEHGLLQTSGENAPAKSRSTE